MLNQNLSPAARKMKAAVRNMIVDRGMTFFTSLLLEQLKIVEKPGVKTACTDGRTIWYDPAYVDTLDVTGTVGLLLEEVGHCILGHPWRKGTRNHSKFNKACDSVLWNTILIPQGIPVADGVFYDPAHKGMSGERVYALLPDDPEGDGAGGQGEGGYQSPGEFTDPQPGTDEEGAPTPAATPQELQADWNEAILKAAQTAKAMGTLPLGADRIVNAIRYPACQDLAAALIELAARVSETEEDWSKPSQVYLPAGLYLPGRGGTETRPICAIVDSSGSISPEILARMGSALSDMLDTVQPEYLRVLTADAAVTADRRYEPGDTIDLNFPGGGGTDFRPALTKAEKDDPAAIVYLTDLDGTMPASAPYSPVLWCVVDNDGKRERAPWGETLWLED